MPILSQGYEPYAGGFVRAPFRFLSIAGVALKRNRRWYAWLLLVLSLLFGSSVEYALVFFVYAATAVFGGTPASDSPWMAMLLDHPRFYPDMMATQTFWALVMGTLVGAGEIAEDLRTGGLVFYLGRPVTRADYLLGKTVAVSVPILLVTTAPTLLLFSLHALFEGTWDWFADHGRVVPASLGYGAVLCLFVSAFVLGVSAVARRRRWATVAIAGVLLGLWTVAGVVAPPLEWTAESEQHRAQQAIERATTAEERQAGMRRLADASDNLGSGSEHAAWRALSPTSTLTAVGRDLFGVPRPSNFPPGRHWVLVLGVSAGLLAVVWRRIRAVEVVS